MMRHDIKLTRLSDTIDQVQVIEWIAEPGQWVEVGDPLVLLETDKVDTEFRSPVAGRVVARHVDVGSSIVTGTVLCTIEDTA